MTTPTRLTIVVVLMVLATVLSWLLSTHGGNAPMVTSLMISAVVVFIALLKARVILREFMEVGLAPPWVRRSTDAWLAIFFTALFVVHFGVKGV